MRHMFPGVPLALASALLFGITPALSKLLLGSIGPLMLAGLLYLGAGVGLSLYVMARSPDRRSEAPLGRADIPWLFGAILMGGVVGPILLVLGLTLTSASNASLLLNVEGLATMGIAWFAFHENVDRRLIVGAAAILAGAALLTWQPNQNVAFDIGALCIVGACLAWGIDNNLTRKVAAADPVTIAMLKGLVAGTINLILAVAWREAWPAPAAAIGAAGLGFLGVGVSLVLFVRALRHLGSARTGAYYSVAPFVGAAISFLLLGEPFSANFGLAAALMGLGVYLHLAERHEHEHDHEALEHEHSHAHDEHHQHHHDGALSEPHSHWHRHEPMRHSHIHYPDLHHQHRH